MQNFNDGLMSALLAAGNIQLMQMPAVENLGHFLLGRIAMPWTHGFDENVQHCSVTQLSTGISWARATARIITVCLLCCVYIHYHW